MRNSSLLSRGSFPGVPLLATFWPPLSTHELRVITDINFCLPGCAFDCTKGFELEVPQHTPVATHRHACTCPLALDDATSLRQTAFYSSFMLNKCRGSLCSACRFCMFLECGSVQSFSLPGGSTCRGLPTMQVCRARQGTSKFVQIPLERWWSDCELFEPVQKMQAFTASGHVAASDFGAMCLGKLFLIEPCSGTCLSGKPIDDSIDS